MYSDGGFCGVPIGVYPATSNKGAASAVDPYVTAIILTLCLF